MNKEYYLKADNVNVKTATTVNMSEQFTLTTSDSTYDLIVNISADLSGVPVEFHEVFVNMLTSKYINKVSFGDNPFSQCLNNKKNNWWKFWNKKIK